MILSLILFALPAHADQESFAAEDMCAPMFQLGLPYGIDDAAVPTDASIPAVVYGACGAWGAADIRLHRMVDGITADEITSEEVTVEADGWAHVLLSPDEPLDDDTDYIVVVSSDMAMDQRAFTTGSEAAQGMAAGAPELELFEITAGELDDGTFNLSVDLAIYPLADPDGLSSLELYSSDDPTTPLRVYLPGTRSDVSSNLFHPSAAAGEACYFVVQTDGLGNVSAASAEVCLTPEVQTAGRSCSSVGAAPMLASSLVAMLMGLRRRRE
jgi:hypothetical protein